MRFGFERIWPMAIVTAEKIALYAIQRFLSVTWRPLAVLQTRGGLLSPARSARMTKDFADYGNRFFKTLGIPRFKSGDCAALSLLLLR